MRSLWYVALLLAGLAEPVAAQVQALSAVQAKDAHVAETEAGGSVAISLMLVNPTNKVMELVGATAPLAGQTVLQRYVKDKDGLVQLQAINSLPLPPKSETVLAPDALELQMIGLADDLKAGFETPLVLKFSDGTQRTIRLKVEGE